MTTMILRLMLVLMALAPTVATSQGSPTVVVIAHPSVGALTATTLQRLYTGRAIEVDSKPISVVNAPAGTALRQRFLEQVLETTEQKYTAYWIVRRHVGKGVPPRELDTAAEVIDFVRQTPGGVGYIATRDLTPGLNVVFRP
jgi:ABC-type phosphate transport system substrate-binding protein